MSTRARTFKEWQKLLAEAANRKYPVNARWTEQDRFLSITRQLADVGAEIQYEQGVYPHRKGEADHRIAALIADVLILAQMRGADIDTEMERVLEFYVNKDAPLSGGV